MTYVIDHKLPASELVFGLFNHHNGNKYTIDQLTFSNPEPYTSAGIQDTRAKINVLINIPDVDVPIGHMTYRRIDLATLLKDCGFKLPRGVLFPTIDMPAIRKLSLERYGLNIDEGFSVHAVTNKAGGFAITAANSNLAYSGTFPVEYFRHLDGDRVQVKSLAGFSYRPPNSIDMWSKASKVHDDFGGAFVDVIAAYPAETTVASSGVFAQSKTPTRQFRLMAGIATSIVNRSYTTDLMFGPERSEYFWETRGNRAVYKVNGREFADLGNRRMACNLNDAKIVKRPDSTVHMIYGGERSAWLISTVPSYSKVLCGNIEADFVPLKTGMPQYVTLSRAVDGSTTVTKAVIRTWGDPSTGKQINDDIVLTNIGEDELLAQYTKGKHYCIGMSEDKSKYYITTKASMRAMVYWEVDVVLNTVRMMRLPASSPLAYTFKNSELYGFYEHGVVARTRENGKWVWNYYKLTL